jgi:carboxymethylenebutenolidase
MDTCICHPERGGPSPAVYVLMDAHGIREELRDMARRLATVGYDVLLPNLDYRAGRDTIFGPDVSVEGSPEHTRMRAVRVTMTIPPVMRDIAGMLACVDRQDAVTPGPVGCHGYCMSGPYALAAPLPMVEELRGVFTQAGVAGEIELYPGVHHGFAFPQRWCDDKLAAERHWERLLALYRRRLTALP